MRNLKNEMRAEIITMAVGKGGRIAMTTGMELGKATELAYNTLYKAYETVTGDDIKWLAKYKNAPSTIEYMEKQDNIYQLYMLAKALFSDEALIVCGIIDEDVNF